MTLILMIVLTRRLGFENGDHLRIRLSVRLERHISQQPNMVLRRLHDPAETGADHSTRYPCLSRERSSLTSLSTYRTPLQLRSQET